MAMTHLEIYDKLEDFYEKLLAEGEALKPQKKDSIETLRFNVIGGCVDIIDELMGILEEEKIFCASCFFLNLDSMRKTVFRYMHIEKDIKDFGALKDIPDVFSDMCKSIKSADVAKYPNSCIRIKNEAYEEINLRD